jgi:hypothetical protein
MYKGNQLLMSIPPVTREGALRSFLLHHKATLAGTTVRFCRIQLSPLILRVVVPPKTDSVSLRACSHHQVFA